MTSRARWRERIDRRLAAMIRVAEAQGWKVTATQKTHIKFRAPNGAVVISECHARALEIHLSKTAKRLRDAGLALPPPR